MKPASHQEQLEEEEIMTSSSEEAYLVSKDPLGTPSNEEDDDEETDAKLPPKDIPPAATTQDAPERDKVTSTSPDPTSTTSTVAAPQKTARTLFLRPTSLLLLLKKYSLLLKTPAQQDRVLKVIQYGLWWASIAFFKNDSTSTRSATARKSLQGLSSDILMARYATRLVEWPTAILAALTDGWVSPSEEHPQTFRWLGRILAWSMVGYYPTEHLAYLHWKAPDWLAHNRSAERYSAISCRCWVVYLVAEAMQSALTWRALVLEKKKKNNNNSKAGKDHGDYDEEEEKNNQQLNSAMTQAKLQLLRDCLFLLPAIHWSLPNWDRDPWLSPKLFNGLMGMEAVVSMWQSIHAMIMTTRTNEA